MKGTDSPAWLPNARGGKSSAGIVFTDLETHTQFLLSPPNTVAELRSDLTRGKLGPDKQFYGIRLVPSPVGQPTVCAAVTVPILTS